jgi:hypothetical protein
MSHDFTYSLNDGVITWKVHEIHLPGSATDYALSQGLVKFSALPQEWTPHNVLIRNSAAIQFDYNPFLITNSVQTKVIRWEEFSSQELIVSTYPNPTMNKVWVSATTEDGAYVSIARADVFSIMGTRIMSKFNDDGERLILNLEHVEQGLYKVIVCDLQERKATVKIVRL